MNHSQENIGEKGVSNLNINEKYSASKDSESHFIESQVKEVVAHENNKDHNNENIENIVHLEIKETNKLPSITSQKDNDYQIRSGNLDKRAIQDHNKSKSSGTGFDAQKILVLTASQRKSKLQTQFNEIENNSKMISLNRYTEEDLIKIRNYFRSNQSLKLVVKSLRQWFCIDQIDKHHQEELDYKMARKYQSYIRPRMYFNNVMNEINDLQKDKYVMMKGLSKYRSVLQQLQVRRIGTCTKPKWFYHQWMELVLDEFKHVHLPAVKYSRKSRDQCVIDLKIKIWGHSMGADRLRWSRVFLYRVTLDTWMELDKRLSDLKDDFKKLRATRMCKSRLHHESYCPQCFLIRKGKRELFETFLMTGTRAAYPVQFLYEFFREDIVRTRELIAPLLVKIEHHEAFLFPKAGNTIKHYMSKYLAMRRYQNATDKAQVSHIMYWKRRQGFIARDLRASLPLKDIYHRNWEMGSWFEEFIVNEIQRWRDARIAAAIKIQRALRMYNVKHIHRRTVRKQEIARREAEEAAERKKKLDALLRSLKVNYKNITTDPVYRCPEPTCRDLRWTNYDKYFIHLKFHWRTTRQINVKLAAIEGLRRVFARAYEREQSWRQSAMLPQREIPHKPYYPIYKDKQPVIVDDATLLNGLNFDDESTLASASAVSSESIPDRVPQIIIPAEKVYDQVHEFIGRKHKTINRVDQDDRSLSCHNFSNASEGMSMNKNIQSRTSIDYNSKSEVNLELHLQSRSVSESMHDIKRYISNDNKAEWEVENMKELVEETAFRLDHPKDWAKKAEKREPIIYPSFHLKPKLEEYHERESYPPFLELLSLHVPNYLQPPQNRIMLGEKPLYILGRGGDNFRDTPRDLPKICPFQKQHVLIRTTWISKTDEWEVEVKDNKTAHGTFLMTENGLKRVPWFRYTKVKDKDQLWIGKNYHCDVDDNFIDYWEKYKKVVESKDTSHLKGKTTPFAAVYKIHIRKLKPLPPASSCKHPLPDIKGPYCKSSAF